MKIVQNGKEIIITQHGRPVGKIIPVPQEDRSLAERIEELERQGWNEPRTARKERQLPPPLPFPDKRAQRYLQEDRDS